MKNFGLNSINKISPSLEESEELEELGGVEDVDVNDFFTESSNNIDINKVLAEKTNSSIDSSSFGINEEVFSNFIKRNFILEKDFYIPENLKSKFAEYNIGKEDYIKEYFDTDGEYLFIKKGTNISKIIELIPVEVFKYLVGDLQDSTDEKIIDTKINGFEFYGRSFPFNENEASFGGDILKTFKDCDNKEFIFQADIEGHGEHAAIYSYIIGRFLEELIAEKISLNKDVIYKSISLLFDKLGLSTNVNVAHVSLVEINKDGIDISGNGQGFYLINNEPKLFENAAFSLHDGYRFYNKSDKNDSSDISGEESFKIVFVGDGILETFQSLVRRKDEDNLKKFKKILIEAVGGKDEFYKFFNKQSITDVDEYLSDTKNFAIFFSKFFDKLKLKIENIVEVCREFDDVTFFALENISN